MYRDGVSDSQFPILHETEVQPMKEALKEIREICPQWNPKLMVIVVKKGGNARFFVQDPQSRQLVNPYVGTVVDQQIVKETGLVSYLSINSSCLINFFFEFLL